MHPARGWDHHQRPLPRTQPPPPDLPTHGPPTIRHTAMHQRLCIPVWCDQHPTTRCPSAPQSSPPSGHIPAVEVGTTLLTSSRTLPPTSPATELLVAADLITKLEQGPAGARDPAAPPLAHHSLDSALSAAQRAQAGAFAALLTTKLQPALLHATWVAQHSFTRFTRVSFGRDLPFPLSFLVPWGIRRSLMQLDMFRGVGDAVTDDALVADATAACRALAAQLATGKGYLLNDEPCSVDALLYGYLVYVLVAPVVPPVLRDVVR